MRILLFLSLVLIQTQHPAFSQRKIKQFVSRNAQTINSISIADTDYADLKPIGDAIGNSRIVMLGEQDHGDAPTFKAKARLIRYLHEQHGFNVLAFESDFFGLTGGYEEVIQDKINVDSLLRGNLFPIWTTCVQFSDTWEYLKRCIKTETPLHLAGIDNQLHGAYTARRLRELVTEVLSSQHSSRALTKPDEVRYLRLLDSLIQYSAKGAMPNAQSDLEWFITQTDSVLSQMKPNATRASFTIMAIQNIRSACRHMQLYKERQTHGSLFAERDVQMAKNLQWLATVKYPNEKIIVWAANGHISKNQFDVEPGKFAHQSLGAYFTRQLGHANETYVLGFNSFEGSAGRTTQTGVNTSFLAEKTTVSNVG